MLPGITPGPGLIAGDAGQWVLVGSTTATSTPLTLPGPPQEGDIVIIGYQKDQDAITGETSGYTSTAWSPASGTTVNAWFGTKVLGASPDTEFAWTSGSANVVCQVWRGVDTGTPIDNGESEDIGEPDMPDPPSHTTVTSRALRVLFGALDDDKVTPTAPSGYSNLVFTNGGSAGTAMLATKIATSAGAEDPDAFGGSGFDQWVAVHTALRLG